MQEVTLKAHELPYEVNEEIKYLRANIQFSGVDKKVILFTSVSASEGKSTVALELAKSLAEMGKRVLLLDTDLRRSELKHQIVNRADVQHGLTHFLSGLAPIGDVLCMTGEPVLYIVFAGPAPPNPSELLTNRYIDTLLEWSRKEFDYILVDSAPLGTVIDAAAIAPKCDGAVLVVEAEKVSYKAAQSVVQQLKNAGCPVMGVVLNKVNYKSHKRYYSHYYRKYEYDKKGGKSN